MKVSLIGLGALGAVLAAHLSPAGVSIIADSPRAARLRAQPVRVNGKALDVTICSPDDTAIIPPDLIIVAVKWAQLRDAIVTLRPFVGEHTILLSAMNGIESEAVLGAAFGPENLLYGFAVEIDAVRKGADISYSRAGTLVFGEATNTPPSARVAAIKAHFDTCGLTSRVPPDMLRELWWKFMLNVSVNQVTAVLRLPYGVFREGNEQVRTLVQDSAREVLALAQAQNIALTEGDIETFFPILSRLDPEKKTSMLQDVEAGRVTENAMLGEAVRRQCAEHGIPAPVNAALARLIAILDSRAG
jgi:2-dehydropantoate 2-reductase